MDSLTYQYIPGTNQFDHVDDGVSAGNYTGSIGDKTIDIDDRGDGNYSYDAIGNLIKDDAEGIAEGDIVWTVYGKIASINKTVGAINTAINYAYDAGGNRIGKRVDITEGESITTRYTWYVRDVGGSVIAIYEKGVESLNEGHLTQTEVPLYGSSRIGI